MSNISACIQLTSGVFMGFFTMFGFWTIMSGLVFVPSDKNCDGSYKTKDLGCVIQSVTDDNYYTVEIPECGVDDCVFTFFDPDFAPVTLDPDDPWTCAVKRDSWNIFTGDLGDLDYANIELGGNECPISARDAASVGAWFLTLAACIFGANILYMIYVLVQIEMERRAGVKQTRRKDTAGDSV